MSPVTVTSTMCQSISWYILLLTCVQLAGGIDMPKLGWNYRFPEKFPVQRAKEEFGWDFRINRTAMSWSWDLPVSPDDVQPLRANYQPLGKPYIVMELSAGHLGWVGAGFCLPRLFENLTEGKMQDCDIVMAWVDSKGVGQICDAWASGNEQPKKDASQDWRLISIAQVDGSTTAIISRDMATDDKADMNFWKPLYLAWAHGNNTRLLKKTDASLCNLPLHHEGNANTYDEYAIFLYDPMIRPRQEKPSTVSPDSAGAGNLGFGMNLVHFISGLFLFVYLCILVEETEASFIFGFMGS